jgi:hypothetical protein
MKELPVLADNKKPRAWSDPRREWLLDQESRSRIPIDPNTDRCSEASIVLSEVHSRCLG